MDYNRYRAERSKGPVLNRFLSLGANLKPLDSIQLTRRESVARALGKEPGVATPYDAAFSVPKSK